MYCDEHANEYGTGINQVLAVVWRTGTGAYILKFKSMSVDVAVLQTLEQAQRRKEIYSALTSNMEEIFR